MDSATFVVADATAMRALGAQLAPHLGPGAVVLLRGSLGAGKTTFAQGVAAALGVTAFVPSPSFVLEREYGLADGRRLIHLDFYRLESAAEVVDLGVADEWGSPDTIVLIEWPEHAGPVLPRDVIAVEIAVTDDVRHVTIRAAGEQSRAMLAGMLSADRVRG